MPCRYLLCKACTPVAAALFKYCTVRKQQKKMTSGNPIQAQYYLLSFGHLWETAISMSILRLINIFVKKTKFTKLLQTGNKDLRHIPLTASLYPHLQPLIGKEHFFCSWNSRSEILLWHKHVFLYHWDVLTRMLHNSLVLRNGQDIWPWQMMIYRSKHFKIKNNPHNL